MYENIIIIVIELSSRIQWTYILKRSCVSFNFMKAVSNLYIFTAVPNLTRNSHKNKEHAIQIICFRERTLWKWVWIQKTFGVLFFCKQPEVRSD